MTSKLFSSTTYSSKMVQNLYDLWQSGCFCDVEIEISGDGEVFKAHRTVLASSSTYFRAMFTGGMAEENKERVILHNISSSVFSTILSFIYTGQVVLTQSTVQDILAASDMLRLPEVIEACTDFLKNELHPSNAIGIYRFAESHSCKSLEKVSLAYVHRHFPQVCEEEEFSEIPKDILIALLKSEKLKVDSEFQVLIAALKWLKFDLQDRKPFVFEVLGLVRLPLLSSRLLQQTIDSLEDPENPSLQVALRSLQKDLKLKKGSLVSLLVQPRKSAKKHVYIIGGSRKKLGSGWKQLSESTLDTVECFDTFKKQYTKVASMEIERILPGVAALDGLIYVVGGEQESKILANGEVYSPQEDTWSMIEPMVIPRCAFGLTKWENYLYAFGGWVGEDIGGSIERYDPALNEWTIIGDMLEPRFSMGVFTLGGLIYIVGGCNHSQRHLKDLCSYNPVTTEWSFLAPMKVPRSQMGIAILGNELYVVGGSSKQAEVLRSVEKYSFEQDKWTEVAPLSHGVCNPAVGAADGRIYVFGGDQSHESNFFRAQVTLSTAEVYDPEKDTWEESIPLPESRSEAGVIVI